MKSINVNDMKNVTVENNTINDLRSYNEVKALTLAEYGRDEGDVMVDNGVEFFLIEEDEGRMRRIDIPRPPKLTLKDEVIAPDGFRGEVTQFDDNGAVMVRNGPHWHWYHKNELSRV